MRKSIIFCVFSAIGIVIAQQRTNAMTKKRTKEACWPARLTAFEESVLFMLNILCCRAHGYYSFIGYVEQRYVVPV